MTDAIEAGARATITDETLRIALDAYLDASAKGYIPEYRMRFALEAAIASGALVPASADNTTRATNATNRIAKIVTMTPEIRGDVHGIIQEAMGGLVPASAVAEMRERCAKVADDTYDDSDNANNPYDGGSGSLGYEAACGDIAAAIRQLDIAPASGDYVVGWRTMDNAPKDGTEIDLWCVNVSLGSNDAARFPAMAWTEDRTWEDWRAYILELKWRPTHWMPAPNPPLDAASSNGGEK